MPYQNTMKRKTYNHTNCNNSIILHLSCLEQTAVYRLQSRLLATLCTLTCSLKMAFCIVIPGTFWPHHIYLWCGYDILH